MITATILIGLMVLCAIYLTIDAVRTMRRDRFNKEENQRWLERHNELDYGQYEPTKRNRKKRG